MKKSNEATIFNFLFIILLSCSAPPSEKQQLLQNAQQYRLTETEQQQLIKELEELEENFNPENNFLKVYRDASANRYHSTMVGMEVHPVRKTIRYAVDLLASGEPAYRERAFAVIEAIISVQDQDTAHNTYGIWPYHYEEPLEAMNKPDWNWADFVSVELLEAYMKYYDILPDDLKEKMQASIIHASRSIQKRDVKPGYTNIAIMGTLVTHLTAHLFDIPDLKAYADMRMKRFYDYTQKLGGFAEYNSPTYTRVALDELQRMRQYILNPSTLEMVNYCYRVGWEVLASHFHPTTAQLAGPHSRSYATLLRDRFYGLLYTASGKALAYNDAKIPEVYFTLEHAIPEDLLPYFKEITTERVEIDTFSFDENPVAGYTYLTPEYCVGTANRSTTWQQRRPYLAYWGTVENPRYLRVRLLHDFEDFGIGNIFSVQEKSEVLTAMNFATNGGDYHISIDRLEGGKFEAEDVRLRFEMADASIAEKISVKNDGFTVMDESITLDVNMLHSVFGDHTISIEKDSDEETCWVDYIIYAGDNQDFDLTKIEKACFAWHTQITANETSVNQGEVQVQEEGGRISVQKGGLQLSVPVTPALEKELQSGVVY